MEKRRPGGVLALALIGLVIGGLGTFAALSAVVNLAFPEALTGMNRTIAEASSQSEAEMEVQLRFQERAMTVTRRWQVPGLTHQGLNVLASALLFVAAILALRAHPATPAVFLGALAANAVVDVGGLVVQTFMQLEMAELLADLGPELLAANPEARNVPGMDRTFRVLMQASAYSSLCFLVFLGLLKLAYYAWGALYLRRPGPRAFFAPAGEGSGAVRGAGTPP